MKILFYDLETYGHDFSANLGYILCASYKWLHEKKVHTIGHKLTGRHVADITNDKFICEQMAALINESDVVVTWNGRDFDHRFLQARMLHHGLGALKWDGQEDLLMTARKRLKMRPRSLGEVGRFLGCKEQKMLVTKEVWMAAGRGEVAGLKEWQSRCVSDVLLLEEIYHKLGPLSNTHPNVTHRQIDGNLCPFCGKDELQSRGRTLALRHYRQRYRCQGCGKWATGNPIKYKNVPTQ
jgi:predicted RNA-binding Zn-ribbon protein involved in translation (DUF1610 family)